MSVPQGGEYIANTILQYPFAVEVRCEDDERPTWERMTWHDFAEANPDIFEWVGLNIATNGGCQIGGGAAPLMILRRED